MVQAVDTSQWGEVAADRMHKQLIDNYGKALQYQDWRKVVSIVSNKDFRAHRQLKIGGYADLATVVERGVYPLMTAPADEETTITIQKHGGIVDQISRELIINDDVGAFGRIPREMARAAARTLYKAVFVDILAIIGLLPPL